MYGQQGGCEGDRVPDDQAAANSVAPEVTVATAVGSSEEVAGAS